MCGVSLLSCREGGDGSFALRAAENRCVLSLGKNSAGLVFYGVNLGAEW